MAANNSQWSNKRNQHSKSAMVVNDSDKLENLSAQVANLTKQLENLGTINLNFNFNSNVSNVSSFASCEYCGDNHESVNCQVGNPFAQSNEFNDINFVGNFQRKCNNPYSNTYNPGWRNHPNFSWNDNTNILGNQPIDQFQIPLAQHQQFQASNFQKISQPLTSFHLSLLEQSLLKMFETSTNFMNTTNAFM